MRQGWMGAYLPVEADYIPWLLQRIGHVTVVDAVHALTKHIVPLFDASALLVATCPSKKAAELTKQLAPEMQAQLQAMGGFDFAKLAQEASQPGGLAGMAAMLGGGAPGGRR